jgi:hypothetical protein
MLYVKGRRRSTAEGLEEAREYGDSPSAGLKWSPRAGPKAMVADGDLVV